MPLQFKADPTGFPMVWVDVIEAYVHWLPVTKIQFETFLCAAPDNHFDEDWYKEVCRMNERLSPGAIRSSNYWRAFLTGITPSEVQRFVRWCGEGYNIPTLEQWIEMYRSLKDLPPEPPEIIKSMPGLNTRASLLLTKINEAARAACEAGDYRRGLAEQMLMRLGAMEWVRCRNQRSEWGGMGSTHPDFHGSLFNPDLGQPSIPVNAESKRLHHYGFRLVWRQQ
jgi:hypothetical protein